MIAKKASPVRWLPNFLTSLRLIASPFLSILLLEERFRYALGLVVLAGLTDLLDGYAARRLGVAGGLGAILDPLCDKTMLVTVFVTLGYMELIPRWMLYLAVARDLIIVVGSILLRIFRGVRRFKPSWVGKTSTFFQILLVLTVLLGAALETSALLWVKTVALALTALFTTLSGGDYILLGIRLTRAPRAIDGNKG